MWESGVRLQVVRAVSCPLVCSAGWWVQAVGGGGTCSGEAESWAPMQGSRHSDHLFFFSHGTSELLFFLPLFWLFLPLPAPRKDKSPPSSADRFRLVQPSQTSPKVSITLEGQRETLHLHCDFLGLGLGLRPI